MKQKFKIPNITPLHEDMDFHIRAWTHNAQVTEAQKEAFPQNKRITRPQLGYDHKNCLRLLKRDGFDGKPLHKDKETGRNQNAVRCYFYTNDGHAWPPDRFLIRYSRFFHLGFHQALALVLKGQWEVFFTQRMGWKDRPTGKTLIDYLKLQQEAAVKHSLEFNIGLNGTADVNQLFHLFEEERDWTGEAGIDKDSFETLVYHMIQSYIHLVGTNSPEMEAFARQHENELNILKSADPADKIEFTIRKMGWMQAENELADLLLKVENQRLRNANVEHKWYATFGEHYIAKETAKCEKLRLERLIQIKEAFPDLSLNQCQEEASDLIRKEKERIKAIWDEIDFITGYELPEKTETSASKISDYDQECKQVLRRIWFLTHENITMHENFTDEQREKLRNYFEASIKIDQTERLYDRRSLSRLKEILVYAELLWEIMGVDLPEEHIIQGKTLADQMQWLESRTSQIKVQIAQVRAELRALQVDEEIGKMRASMVSQDKIDEVRQDFENLRTGFEQKIRVLKEMFDRLFEKSEANDTL
jgi:hypothetical protein